MKKILTPAVEKTVKQISNNMIIYIPIMAALFYFSNRYYLDATAKGISLLTITGLTIFLTSTLFKNNNDEPKAKNFYTYLLAVSTLSLSVNTVLTLILFIVNRFTMQYEISALLLNLLASIAGSIFFSTYTYGNNVYKKEYRNLISTVTIIIFMVIVSLAPVTFNIVVAGAMTLGFAFLNGLFSYGHFKNPTFEKAEYKQYLKTVYTLEAFKTWSPEQTLLAALFTVPYAVLISNGYLTLFIFISSILMMAIIGFTHNALKTNMILTRKDVYVNNSKSRKGILAFLAVSIAVTSLNVLFASQTLKALTINNINTDYTSTFIALLLCALPLTVAILYIDIYNDSTFFKNFKVESLFTSAVTAGILIFSRVPSMPLGTAYFITLIIFLAVCFIKDMKKGASFKASS